MKPRRTLAGMTGRCVGSEHWALLCGGSLRFGRRAPQISQDVVVLGAEVTRDMGAYLGLAYSALTSTLRR